MPDYAAMYKILFNSQTDAIRILQKAQQDTEEMYMSTQDPVILVLDTTLPADNDDSDNADDKVDK